MTEPIVEDESPSSQSESGWLEGVLGQQSAEDSVQHELMRSQLLASLFTGAEPALKFGRFELREHIGAGGMGHVYRAWDPQLEREVAIKLIDTAKLGPSMRERSLREAKSLAKISHPNVITVFEAGLVENRVWIAMEFVPGTTLRQWQRREPKPSTQDVLQHWIDVGRGLTTVHAVGLVHRDVKPDNVLIGEDGRARLIDFGLVRNPGAALAHDDEQKSTSQEDRAVTTAGFVGTYAYAAPEQFAGVVVSAAADQYSLCVGIWESICGAMPPRADRREGSSLTPPMGAGISRRVESILARGLSLEPGARYARLSDLVDALEATTKGPSHRAGVLLGGALGALVAGVALLRVAEPEPPSPCAYGPEPLAGTWDEERRVMVRERFAQSTLPFASVSASEIEAELDAWAERWLRARHAACVATKIDGVQSDTALELRNTCLERQRRALLVGLDTLLDEVGSDAVVARAPELVADLPSLASCADPVRLATAEPLPEEHERRAAILDGFDQLTRARALVTAGEREAAASVVAPMLEAAGALDYPPLTFEVQAFPAQQDLLRERVDAGVLPLVEVARKAEGKRLDELAARLMVEAAEAAAGRWSRPELERWLLDDARSAVARLARDPEPLAVKLRIAEAKLWSAHGELERALAGFVSARELAAELGYDDEANNYKYVAATLGRLGRFEEAGASLEAGRAAARARWGDAAPSVGSYEYNLAVLALETGKFEMAARHLDRAEAIYRNSVDGDSFFVARIEFARAKISLVEGRFDDAAALLDHVVPVYVREFGAGSHRVAKSHEARGVVRYYQGDIVGSIESYSRALEIAEQVLGPKAVGLALLHSNLGESRLAQAEYDKALEQFDLALSIYAQSLPDDHPDLALPLKGRGKARLETGRAPLAIPDLRRALELHQAAKSEPLELADVRFLLAGALVEAGVDDGVQARALASRARADFVVLHLDERVEDVDAWLATVPRRRRRRPTRP